MALSVSGRMWSGIRDLAGATTATIDGALNEHRIRLAITGLSRSGKTAFITSLLQNLIALGAGRDTLPRLSRRLDQHGHTRLRAVKLLPTGVETIPYFDFPTKLAGLAAAQPAWPAPTADLSQISLSLVVEHQTPLRQWFGHRRVRLDILDYPGEWLLDLPLLGQSFPRWSADTMDALATPPRLPRASGFLDFVRTVSPTDPADEATIRQGHRLYVAAIKACRRELGLRYLQPGRFLAPGPWGDAPFMWFFPLPCEDAAVQPGSIAHLLRERFDAYRREVRASFFDTHFRAFNRQIMLVDVLDALYAGRTAFEDTARAVHDLAAGLRGGRGFWTALASAALPGPLKPRPMERVAFVATKADRVPQQSRANLQRLLEALAEPAATSWEQARATVSYHVAAAISATQDGTAVIDGRTVDVVEGRIPGESRVRPFYVGEIPAEIPPPAFWTAPYFEMPVFQPPKIDASGTAGIRHLGLDAVLDAVIGDLL